MSFDTSNMSKPPQSSVSGDICGGFRGECCLSDLAILQLVRTGDGITLRRNKTLPLSRLIRLEQYACPTNLEMFICIPYLLHATRGSSVQLCSFWNMVDIMFASSPCLMSKLILIYNLLHQLFRSAMANSRKKLNRISDRKLVSLVFYSEPLCQCL